MSLLPCELPLSSPGNPSSLPGAIAALSAQVTSTMLEVRQEIGELKCEFIQVRGLSLELATSLIREQTQKLKSELLNTKEHEKNLALVIQLAVSIIRHGTQGIRSLFGKTG